MALDCADIIDYDFFKKEKSIKLYSETFEFKIVFKYFFQKYFWIQGLTKTIEYEKNIKFSKLGIIKYNITKLLELYSTNSQHEIEKFLDKILLQLKKEKRETNFFQNFNIVNKEIIYFIDAYYSNFKSTEIDSNILRKSLCYINKYLISKIIAFWNNKSIHFTPLKILKLLQIINNYKKSLFSWNIIFNNFENLVENIIKSFISKLYYNSKIILTNILVNIKKNYYKENNIILTNSSIEIENYICLIFSYYKKIPLNYSCYFLLELCSNFLLYFFLNLKELVNLRKLKINIYTALLNNKYYKVIKSFFKFVIDLTEKKVSRKFLKIIFNEEYLLTLINDIEKICLKNVSYDFRKIVRASFKTKRKFLRLKFLKKIETIYMEMGMYFRTIEKKFYLKEIYFEIFQEFFLIYIKYFLEYSQFVKKKDYDQIKTKILSDKYSFALFIKSKINPNQLKIFNYRFEKIYTFFISEDLDEVIVELLNFYFFYENIAIKENLIKMIEMKIYFIKKAKNYILNYLTPILEEEYRKTLAIYLKPIDFPTNIYVFLFIKNLKKNVELKKLNSDLKFDKIDFYRSDKDSKYTPIFLDMICEEKLEVLKIQYFYKFLFREYFMESRKSNSHEVILTLKEKFKKFFKKLKK